MQTTHLKRLALFRLSAIGDVVMMIPVVRAIQRHYPNCEITWITSQSAYPILEGLSGVKFIVIDKPNSIFSFLRVGRLLRKNAYDVLLAAQASLRANLLYPFIKAPRKIGFDKQRSRDGHHFFVNEQITFKEEHLLDGFMRFAKALGVSDNHLEWGLPIPQEAIHWAKTVLSKHSGRWVAINPMASKVERNWLELNYVALIDELHRRHKVNIVLTGGPSALETALSERIASASKAPCLVLTGKTNLKQLAALLGEVDCLIAPDTGPVHIATAMSTPVIGLYAVAPSKLSGPYRSQSLVIDKYSEAVERYLNCSSTEVGWGKRVHHPDAMSLISVDQVLEKVGEVL